MKRFAIASAVLAAAHLGAHAVQHVEGEHRDDSPIAQVVSLLGDLNARIVADGKAEQQSYDTYACWCEDTLGRKARDISTSKEDLGNIETLVVKLNGEIASHGADIKDLDTGISANVDSQREAFEAREREVEEYNSEKIELEQSIGALVAAMKVLSGAGSGKKGFLETFQEAQVHGVVAGLRGVLRHAAANRDVSVADLAIVKHFVDKPEDFINEGRSGVSAVQIVQNPFGDYAPQSTQIQGILRGMHDAFSADLEKSSAEEVEQQKAFEALMRTKKAEHVTLQTSLERHTLRKAEKTKAVVESQQLFDDTQAQLKADEVFFEETKSACKSKAGEWSTRTRLRTEESQSIHKAIEILSSSSSVGTFENATGTAALLQLAFARHERLRIAAFRKIQAMSLKYNSASVTRIAQEIRSGGHFDQVIASIDKMTELLRKEEQDDIEHRDRCQLQQTKNDNDMSDLSHSVSASESDLIRKESTKKSLQQQVGELEKAIAATRTNLEQLLTQRNTDHSVFIQSLKDDSDAVDLLQKAIIVLTDFYRKNRIDLNLAQKSDPDQAPETSWKGAEYGGRSSESSGIIAILSMIKEDFEKEMKTARSEDSGAEAKYREQLAALKATEKTQMATHLASEAELAELEKSMSDIEQSKDQMLTEKASEASMKEALKQDCAWVESHFDSRREKRKNEMAGLVEAKNYLAGVEAGTEMN
eukprot:TRINITY_DN3908_c0_g1_i2.p1 TRINITY_DN3908_c0_g1~~TRINITY_DN3908_c0_g1_i2.p1  ORF type:complete len:704 (-),score=175.63 TRINITY_DN3908_c0_g1_i2:76-2187(-)